MKIQSVTQNKQLLKLNSYLLSIALIMVSACSPKIYIIDRQTVLYESAAGEWPEFEKSLLPRLKKKSPIPYSQVSASENEKNNRLFRIIDGELTNPSGEKLQ